MWLLTQRLKPLQNPPVNPSRPMGSHLGSSLLPGPGSRRAVNRGR